MSQRHQMWPNANVTTPLNVAALERPIMLQELHQLNISHKVTHFGIIFFLEIIIHDF